MTNNYDKWKSELLKATLGKIDTMILLDPKIDPIHFKDGRWWFWDETWAHEWGPFSTCKAAEEALQNYKEFLENGPADI